MNTETDTDGTLMKDLILNTKEPLLIRNVLNWELLKWDLNKWEEILGSESLKFRHGKNSHTIEPQFENTTGIINMSFKEFLQYQEENPEEWLYFDYKYLKEWLINISELQTNINWKDFGFPNRSFEDSTIWIGSKGAHTPCHVDTYGCNLIAQILGRKQWLLFPPNENLLPTRIPYEESSIYSSINLFAPNTTDFSGLNRCRSVILNPGDVLVLPHRWWHFVENLELAISINTWIELPIDHEERIGESIVLMLVSQLSKQLNPEQQQYLLNPTDAAQAIILNQSIWDSIQLTNECIKKQKHQKLEEIMTDVNEILSKLKNVETIQELPKNQLEQLLMMQSHRFGIHAGNSTIPEDKRNLKKILDAVLQNDVINLIKEKLLQD